MQEATAHADAVVVVRTPKGLSTLNEPTCAAVIWERPVMPSFQDWIDGLAPVNLPTARLILHPRNARTQLTEICDRAGLMLEPHREHMINDIIGLIQQFTALVAAPYVRFRFDRVTTNACRRFHIDAITARLVCTYRGSGTQYGIARKGSEPEHVSTVPTGSPILLRGTLWPEQPNAGVLHRSPPIEGTGETRLVLVLDPIFDPNGEM
jgi:hypothetical protein